MDFNHLKQIKTLLIAMQTEQVAKAEAELTQYADKQGNLFFEYMITIMSGSCQGGLLTQQEQWIKTIAASFVNSYLHAKADDQILLVSQVLKKILYHPNIKQLDKRCMEKSICKMLSEAQEDLQKEWQGIIRQFLKNKPYYDCAYLLIACFAIAEGVTYTMIRNLITSSFDAIISSLEVNIQNANLLNEMLKMWIVIIDSLRKEQENKEILLFIANNQRLLDLIDLLYEFQSLDGVIVCLNPNLYELNLLKYQAAQLNKRLLIVSEESVNICQTLMNYSKKNFNKFARTLHILSMQKQHFDTLGCQDLLTTLFSLQILYVSYNPQQISYQTAVGIIQNEILPLIHISDEQREKFEESSEQFNCLAEDCCDKQTFGILKTQGVKLLQILADSVEGVFKYIITKAVESIKVNAGFSQYSPQQPQILSLELSFLILSVLSYGLAHHPEEVAVLKAILNDNRMKQLAPLEMSRVLTFLAYNYNQVYKQPSEGEDWIAFSLNYNAHPTTSYCALDFISNIIDEYFNQALLELLLKGVVQCKISLIWQILTKLFKHQFLEISTQGIINIILKLFERMNYQINQLKSEQKKNTLDLINCINLFLHLTDSLIDEKSQSQNHQRVNKILTYVWPITHLYQTVAQWDLEDTIVKITTKIINIIPSIMSQIHQLIPQFITAFKINGYFEKYYLQFFNQFALKADYIRDQSSLILIFITLKDGLLHNIMSSKAIETAKSKASLRLAIANILVVLQNLIANHGNGLLQSNSLEFFNQIGSLCIQLLPKINEQVDKSSSGRIIYSRALNTLFLCHIHLKTDCFYDYLKILKDENIFHGFDTKVFVLCAQKQIFRETDVSAISFLIQSLLNIIKKSAQKQQKIKKQKNSKKVKAGVPSQLKKIEQFDKILKTIDSPFERNAQLSDQVSNLFNLMHSGNQQMFAHLIKCLPAQTLQTLKKYIDLDGTSKKRRVYRKVVGIKQGASGIEVEHSFSSSNKKKKYDNDGAADENGDSEEEEDDGLKRQRVKTKTDKKKKNNTRKLHQTQQ